MNKANLKKILHALVESINNKHTLYHLQKDAFPYVIKNRTKKKDNEGKDLTEEQKLQPEEAIKQADEGDSITIEEFEEQMEKQHPDYKKIMKRHRKQMEKEIRESSKKKLKRKLHKRIDKIKSKYVLNVLLNDVMPGSL